MHRPRYGFHSFGSYLDSFACALVAALRAPSFDFDYSVQHHQRERPQADPHRFVGKGKSYKPNGGLREIERRRRQGVHLGCWGAGRWHAPYVRGDERVLVMDDTVRDRDWADRRGVYGLPPSAEESAQVAASRAATREGGQ